MTLQQIEKLARAQLKSQETLQKNTVAKRQNLLKKLQEIDEKLTKIDQEKRKIRSETKKKIVQFAKTNF